MFNNILNSLLNFQSRTIGGAGLLLALLSFCSALLGVFRDALLASRFGASQDLDIYYAAFRIPDFVYSILIFGAISAAFIPLFNKFLKQSKEEAWNFTNNILGVLLVAIGALALILIIFAPFIVRWIVPGFSAEAVSKVVVLTRLMMVQPLLLGLSGIVAGVLQSFRRFLITGLAPLFYNLGIIFGIVVLVPIFGLIGLAFGVVLGAFFHFLVQIPSLFELGFRFRFLVDFRSEKVRQVFSMMVPRTLSLLSSQINLFIITIIASTISAGSLAIFNLANNLQNFPAALFGVSFAVAAFPLLSQTKDTKKEFLRVFRKTALKIIYLLLPISVLYIIFHNIIVRLILGYGKFGAASQALCGKTLLIFSFGILAYGLLPLMVRVFFALEDSKTPFFCGLWGNILTATASFSLAKTLGVLALALAMTLGAWLNLILLIIFFWRKHSWVKSEFQRGES